MIDNYNVNTSIKTILNKQGRMAFYVPSTFNKERHFLCIDRILEDSFEMNYYVIRRSEDPSINTADWLPFTKKSKEIWIPELYKLAKCIVKPFRLINDNASWIPILEKKLYSYNFPENIDFVKCGTPFIATLENVL